MSDAHCVPIMNHVARRSVFRLTRVSSVCVWRASRSVLVFVLKGGHVNDDISSSVRCWAGFSLWWEAAMSPLQQVAPSCRCLRNWLAQTWTMVSVSVWRRVHSAFCSNEWQCCRVPTEFIATIGGVALDPLSENCGPSKHGQILIETFGNHQSYCFFCLVSTMQENKYIYIKNTKEMV